MPLTLFHPIGNIVQDVATCEKKSLTPSGWVGFRGRLHRTASLSSHHSVSAACIVRCPTLPDRQCPEQSKPEASVNLTLIHYPGSQNTASPIDIHCIIRLELIGELPANILVSVHATRKHVPSHSKT